MPNDLIVDTGLTPFSETNFLDMLHATGVNKTYVGAVIWPNGEGLEVTVQAPGEKERILSMSWDEADAVLAVVKSLRGK